MKYYNYLSGGMTPEHLSAAMLMAFFGFVVYKAITGIKRDRVSHRTPAKFDWKFWFKDNAIEAAQSFVIVLAIIRFYSEIVHQFAPELERMIQSQDPMWPYFV